MEQRVGAASARWRARGEGGRPAGRTGRALQWPLPSAVAAVGVGAACVVGKRRQPVSACSRADCSERQRDGRALASHSVSQSASQ